MTNQEQTTNDNHKPSVRSDHLEAVILYALEQARVSDIPVLDFSDNENDCQGRDAISALENMLLAVRAVYQDHHQDIYLIDVLEHTSLLDMIELRGF